MTYALNQINPTIHSVSMKLAYSFLSFFPVKRTDVSISTRRQDYTVPFNHIRAQTSSEFVTLTKKKDTP